MGSSIRPGSTPYLAAAREFSAVNGCTQVTALLRLLRLRLRHGLGPFYFTIFNVDGRFPAPPGDYIKQSRFIRRELRWNPQQHHQGVDNKVEFFLRCQAASVRSAPVLGAVCRPSNSLQTGIPRIESGSDLVTVTHASGHSEFFLKPSNGINGLGALRLQAVHNQFRIADEPTLTDGEHVVRHLLQAAPPGQTYLLQPRLRNTPALAPIMSPHGLGTVRLITMLDGGNFEAVVACLRMTVGHNVVDNFLLGAGGNVIAPVDILTGTLGQPVASRTSHWPYFVTTTTHPETGHTIEGFTLPRWKDLLDLADKGHRLFSEMKVLGWDIAIDEHGPVLIEANHNWDIEILQIAHRKGLAPELAARLGALWGVD